MKDAFGQRTYTEPTLRWHTLLSVTLLLQTRRRYRRCWRMPPSAPHQHGISPGRSNMCAVLGRQMSSNSNGSNSFVHHTTSIEDAIQWLAATDTPPFSAIPSLCSRFSSVVIQPPSIPTATSSASALLQHHYCYYTLLRSAFSIYRYYDAVVLHSFPFIGRSLDIIASSNPFCALSIATSLVATIGVIIGGCERCCFASS